MTVINGRTLFEAAPIKNMLSQKEIYKGVSHGLSEAGYDIRLKQDITFSLMNQTMFVSRDWNEPVPGRFCIASAIEEFDMPDFLVGIVHDKSTLARRGLSVFNTVIEPGWKGFLTLELVYHGSSQLTLPAGTGIAQVIFHQLAEPRSYAGKYQNQEDKPVAARSEPPFVSEPPCDSGRMGVR